MSVYSRNRASSQSASAGKSSSGSAPVSGARMGAAAAGPAGAAVGAAGGAAFAIGTALGAAARAAVQFGAVMSQNAAALNTAGVANQFEQLAGTIPLVGDALVGLSQTIRGVMAGLDQTARTLAPYSGALSMAQAQNTVLGVQGNMRRANLLGDDLAAYTNARARFEQEGQDALAELMKPFIPVVTGFIEFLNDFLRWLKPYLIQATDYIIEAINAMLRLAEAALNEIPGVNVKLGQIEKNTAPKKNDKTFVDQLMEMESPFVGAPPAGALRRQRPIGIPGLIPIP